MKALFNITQTSIFGIFFGIFLIALSFSTLRATYGFGVIELIFLIILLLYILNYFFLKSEQFHLFPFTPLIYVILFVTPLTIINVNYEFYGSEFSTALALLLATTVGAIVSTFNKNFRHGLAFGVGICCLASVLFIIFSGSLVETIFRFAFLSGNPNTLALYSLCACFIVCLLYPKNLLRSIFVVAAVFYGIISLSDSLFLALVVGSLFGIACYLLKHGLLFVLLISFGIIFFIFIINMELNIINALNDLWVSADEGGSRISLLIHGIEAYLESPFLGHGAGAFSGHFHPFGRFEAHNTYVDLLTIGGPFLALIFLMPLVISIPSLYRNNEFLSLVFLMAIIIFAFFHFTARHPVIWAVWGICIASILSKEFLVKD